MGQIPHAAETAAAETRSGMVRAVLDFIGPDVREGVTAPARPFEPGWVAALCLIVAVGLLLVVAGHGAGRRDEDIAMPLFAFGVLVMVVPISLRIGWPTLARGERLFLLVLLAQAFFFFKVAYSPTGFSSHDEFLHWIAADDMLTAGRLYLSNTLLSIGAAYPALEILTTAIANLTGLSPFAAGTLLLAALKATFIAAMFLFFEKLAGSARMAAVACLVYMGCSTYVMFESAFSYESLGIVFCALIFAAEALSRDLDEEGRLKASVFIVLLLAALAVTHHLSSAYAVIYLSGLAILELVRRDASPFAVRTAVVLALVAVALPALWLQTWGDPIIGYLGPVIQTGIRSLIGRFTGTPPTQMRVEAMGMPAQPLVIKLTTLCGILLLSLALATGLFRTLAAVAPAGAPTGWRRIAALRGRRWRDSRVLFVASLAFAFPVSVAFRLTAGGWEIGNRMGTLAFVGVGLVVATSVVRFWQGGAPQGWRRLAPALGLAVVVLGGVTVSNIDPIRGPYRVGGDAESIEPMAIGTALWTKEWLGPGNRFVADRVNRLLLASYGRQDVKLKVVDGVATARVFEPEKLDSDDLYALRRSDLDFLLVDLRLTTAPPLLGFYFEPWESNRGDPLSPAALLKFDRIDGIGRIYDNGDIKIFDVRRLHERP